MGIFLEGGGRVGRLHWVTEAAERDGVPGYTLDLDATLETSLLGMVGGDEGIAYEMGRRIKIGGDSPPVPRVGAWVGVFSGVRPHAFARAGCSGLTQDPHRRFVA